MHAPSAGLVVVGGGNVALHFWGAGLTNRLVINSSFAAALRRGKSRESGEQSLSAFRRAIKGGRLNYHEILEQTDLLAGMHRRGPKPGLVSGYELATIEVNSKDGSHNVFVVSVDKRGEIIWDRYSRLLLHVTQHATESMYQRLRTTDRHVVLRELKPTADWLSQNSHMVALEEEGLLLTPGGVFPVVRGPAFFAEETDGRYSWDATTWISDEGLEDHTPQKRRLAQAARKARAEGQTFVPLQQTSKARTPGLED